MRLRPAAIAEVNGAAVPGALSRRSFELITSLGELFHTVERPGATRTGFVEPARAGASAEASARRVAVP